MINLSIPCRSRASPHPSQCVKINPAWSKGYARKGAALHGQRRYDDAVAAYEAGLKLEDSPALRKGLKEVQDAKGMCAATKSMTIDCSPSPLSCGRAWRRRRCIRHEQDVRRPQPYRKTSSEPSYSKAPRRLIVCPETEDHPAEPEVCGVCSFWRCTHDRRSRCPDGYRYARVLQGGRFQ